MGTLSLETQGLREEWGWGSWAGVNERIEREEGEEKEKGEGDDRRRREREHRRQKGE